MIVYIYCEHLWERTTDSRYVSPQKCSRCHLIMAFGDHDKPIARFEITAEMIKELLKEKVN